MKQAVKISPIHSAGYLLCNVHIVQDVDFKLKKNVPLRNSTYPLQNSRYPPKFYVLSSKFCVTIINTCRSGCRSTLQSRLRRTSYLEARASLGGHRCVENISVYNWKCRNQGEDPFGEEPGLGNGGRGRGLRFYDAVCSA